MQSVGAAVARVKLQTMPSPKPAGPRHVQYVGLRCPECTARMDELSYHALGGLHEPVQCGECAFVLAQRQNIWLALARSREPYFQRFVREYEMVRRAEGRGSENEQFYLSLPFADRTGRNSWQWSIRARTYKYLEQTILPQMRSDAAGASSILDLGAGNGWLSYRLATLGHRPLAFDLLTNSFDGLGAAAHYRHALPMLFPRVQGELDRLPFESGQFDGAIFNASFHYSENYDRTLAEAIRCLRPGGLLVIADSPFYTRDESGQQMLSERRSQFQKKYGSSCHSLDSKEYLTKDMLLALEARHSIEWTTHDVWYGFRWAMRPLLARLRNQREPSQFRIYTARVRP
jgi:SAM-dependent methyltransferase